MALIVSVEVLAVMSGFGLKVAFTPLGKPETFRLTEKLVPDACGVTGTLTFDFRDTVADVGALIVKLSHTVSATLLEWTGDPPAPVPVTVTV